MPLSKHKKKEVLTRLKSVAQAKALAFVNFHGLTVANAIELRRKLKEAGVSYFVSKKTLAKKALSEAGIEGAMPELSGELGIAYLMPVPTPSGVGAPTASVGETAEDLTAPARESFSFQKKFENRISLLGGVFEGRFIGIEEAKALALIPSRQTLYAQFVNITNSPLQGLVMVLDGVAKSKVTN